MVESTEKSISISKGIIYTFFCVYLIFYGIGISESINAFNRNNPEALPMYVSYIPFACYMTALFLVFGLIIFIRNLTTHRTREVKARKKAKVKVGSLYKSAVFLVIFIFSFIPLFSFILDQGQNDQYFSIYNLNYWNGASDLKLAIENEGYTVMAIQSSLSATERITESGNQSILLILLGCNQFYDPMYEIPYFIDFFRGRNSLLICHDHGSTSTLLWEIFIASQFYQDVNIPITIFPDGILRDNESYAKTPEFPVIKSFTSHPTTRGINQVVLSKSSCAVGGPFVQFSGWNVVGSSSRYSYVDKNGDHMYSYEEDNVDLRFMNVSIPGIPTSLLKIPLGGYPQSVFMAKDLGGGRIFVSGDASLFNNELIDHPDYDNQQFAINIISWLTYSDTDWIVVFDEAHVRPEESRDMSSAGIFGFIMQYIIHLSTNPITAWIYPILAIYTLRKYMPKKSKLEEKEQEKEEEKKEAKAKFRTSSFFAEKIEWYREKRKYGKALILLYRRLERKLNNLLGGEKITAKNVIEMVTAKDPDISRQKIRRLTRFMNKILAIKNGKMKVRNEFDFEDLFFEMEWTVRNL